MPTTHNRKLTDDVLDDLIDPESEGIHLEVANVDVKRLRDERSEILGGQEVAFVATATFRATANTATILKNHLGSGNIAVGDALFVIGNDAEVRSEALEIDEDSIALWLDEHYAFTFTLNGVANTDAFEDLGAVAMEPTTPGPHDETLVLPWLRKLNTGAFKDGYIDVDVRITEKEIEPPDEAKMTCRVDVPSFSVVKEIVINGDRTERDRILLQLDLEVGDTEMSLADLVAKGLRIPIEVEDGDVPLALVFRQADPNGDKKTPTELARPNATHPHSKQKP